jgi:hypothetical protein
MLSSFIVIFLELRVGTYCVNCPVDKTRQSPQMPYVGEVDHLVFWRVQLYG